MAPSVFLHNNVTATVATSQMRKAALAVNGLNLIGLWKVGSRT